jgi:hypothetical protein
MVKIKHRTLGLSLGRRRPGEAALGYALLEETGTIKHRAQGNPLDLVLLNVAEGEHVALLAYSDEESFASSQAARDGLTRREHLEFLEKLVLELRTYGRSASIKWVTAE